jgi:hypothetical protein
MRRLGNPPAGFHEGPWLQASQTQPTHGRATLNEWCTSHGSIVLGQISSETAPTQQLLECPGCR